MNMLARPLCLLSLAAFCASCGGGGGGTPTTAPPDVNLPGEISLRVIEGLNCFIAEDGTINGVPFSGATVTAIDNSGARNDMITATDASGEARLDLLTGSYDIVVDAEGHEPITVEGVLVIPDSETPLGDIELLIIEDYFPNGVAAGDVDQSSVVLWTRGRSEGIVRFEYGRDRDFSELDGAQNVKFIIPESETLTIPKTVRISGLSAGTQYYYRACRGDKCQPSELLGCEARGSFRTPFDVVSQHGLSFGVSSCFKGELKPFVSIKNVPEKNLDFFVALGDTAYADSKNPDGEGATKTLAKFREKHEFNYSQKKTIDDNFFAQTRASTAFYVTIDDHEVVDNFAGGAPPATHTQNTSCKLALAQGKPKTDFNTARCLSICDPADDPNDNCSRQFINETDIYQNGMQAWYEYNPVRMEKYGATGEKRTTGKYKLYRYRTFGKDAAMFMLDARSFRDKEQFLIGLGSSRTMLGNAQLRDLKRDLLAAEKNGITWKFILISVPIQHLDPFTAGDRFEGYDIERQELLDFIEKNCISNVVFISGDIHGSVANNLSYKKPPLLLQRFGSSWDISTGPGAKDEPLGRTVTENATTTDRNALDELFAQALDTFFYALSLPRTGLDPEKSSDFFKEPPQWQYRAEVAADLKQGGYVAVHTYGWTEFKIDVMTQKLLVTTYGIDWYDTSAVKDENLQDLLAREPFVVSQFEVEPQFGCQGGKPNGKFCSDDTMCQSRLCNAGLCTSPQPNGNICVRDEGCISGLCNAGICTDPQPNGNICIRDEGCISGLCDLGTCTDPQPNGEVCFQDEACISGLCNAGICTSRQPNGNICIRDEGCISGLCDLGTCTDPQPNGEVCFQDEACITGLCNAGICTSRQPNGNICVRDEGCQSGLCNAGICTDPQPNGNICVRDDGCISGLCNVGICTDPQPNGNICVGDVGCISGLCNAGICTSRQPNGNVCVRDDGCQSDLCNAGICTSPQANGSFCVRDKGCVSDLCNAGTCTSPQANGKICVRDKGCTSGLCDVGICTVPFSKSLGTPCIYDRACKSGNCFGLVCGF